MAYLLMIALLSSSAVGICSGFQTDDTTAVFPDISRVPKAGEPRIYAPDSLYKYIDGAAEAYLTYDFQELAVQIYENEREQSLTVEIYRHSNSRNGFGIYSQERPTDGNFLQVGAQGYYEEGILNFVRGSYYVKLSAFRLGDDEKSLLTATAKDIASRLEGELHFPEIVGRFPENGKVKNSERYIPKNFLGYSFLANAFTCDYSISDARFKLFIIEGADSANAAEVLGEYLRATKHSGIGIEEGHHIHQDAYHGEIDLLWKGRYICGVLDLDDRKLGADYVALIKAVLEDKN